MPASVSETYKQSASDENEIHKSAKESSWKDALALPEPIKRIFAKFPLLTHAANARPSRSPQCYDKLCLYIFADRGRAARGATSHNPTCLKWQTYLKIQGIDFHTAASSNHAAPEGALPFLIPASLPHERDGERPRSSIGCSKLRAWVDAQDKKEESKQDQSHAPTHAALIDHRLRKAWMCQLYLDPVNFDAVARPLYIDNTSTNIIVQTVSAHQLHRAALLEVGKTTARDQSVVTIMDEAKEALSALSTLLGNDQWFFASHATAEKEARGAGLFDAAVFAYTHLLLDGKTMRWRNNELGDALRSHANLVEHRDRILHKYFAPP